MVVIELSRPIPNTVAKKFNGTIKWINSLPSQQLVYQCKIASNKEVPQEGQRFKSAQ
jgi:hypothetical protein